MDFNITARHLDLTPSISDYVHRKVEKAQRYYGPFIWAQTILAVEKHRHIAEVIVHTPGSTFRTKAEAGDLYAAIDGAAHKLDLHMAKVKDKQKNHRHISQKQLVKHRSSNSRKNAVNPVEKLEVLKTNLLPMSNVQAIKELDKSHLPFFLFINENTMQVCAAYKKNNRDYAIVETENEILSEKLFRSTN